VSPDLGKNTRSEEEHLLLREDADAIEKKILRTIRLAPTSVEGCRKLGLSENSAPEKARIDYRVNDFRKLRKTVAKCARCRESSVSSAIRSDSAEQCSDKKATTACSPARKRFEDHDAGQDRADSAAKC